MGVRAQANPGEVPRYPEAPPPRAASPRPWATAPEARSVRLRLEPGWNLISFPFSRVLSCRGLDWQLLDGERPLDAGLAPEKLETTRAFWAYAEEPTQVEATGLTNPGDRPAGVALKAGWNAVGCPFDRPVDLTAASCGEPPRPLDAACQQKLLNDHAFRWEDGRVAAMPLERARLLPYAGHWIYASQSLTLNFNQSGSAPFLTGMRQVGDELLLEGRGLGTTGTVWSGAAPLEALSWDESQVRLRAPQTPGSLRLVSQGRPSNTLELPGNAPSPTRLVGQVLDDEGVPVPGARVWIDGGEPVKTDAQGSFTMAGLAPGAHQVRAALAGEDPVRSLLEFTPGLGRRVVLTLPSRRGNLSVRAYSYKWGNKNWRPHRILVWERGNYSRRYRKDFWYDWGWSGYNLDWYRLPLGRTYEIQVTWKDEQGNQASVTRWRRLTSSQQIEYVYNSWTY